MDNRLNTIFDLLNELDAENVERKRVFSEREDGFDAIIEVLQRLTQEFRAKKSERDALQKKLAKTEQLLVIGQLAAGVAHEVNNPASYLLANLQVMQSHLNKLKIFTELLVERSETTTYPDERLFLTRLLQESRGSFLLEELYEMAQDNLQGVERIRRIVNDLRMFARIEVEEIEYFQINDALESACNIAKNEIRHRAQLVKKLGILPKIAGDRIKLNQVFLNIILNAAQSITEGAASENKITITSYQKNDQLVLTIEDTGCGISVENQKRIFDPFFSTKPKETGTGLGLSLSLETIHRHKGQITVESEIGQGTTFHVCLPVDTRLRPTKYPEQSEAAFVPKYQRKRILLIDDEPLVRRSIARVLKRFHDVIEVASGLEAIDILEQDIRFDVIFCDVMMPKMDGPQLYDLFCEKLPEVAKRMIFISGGAFTPRTKEFVKNSKNLILKKPISPKELLGIIERITSS